MKGEEYGNQKINSWIFAIGMALILYQYYGIADKNLAAVLAVIGSLCAIYAVYTNESISKFKYGIIGLYVVFLIIYFVNFFNK